MTCTRCGADNRAGARFCDLCGAALESESAREQRKVVTVLFCDVAGSTALGERLDPEAVRVVMARYFETARAAIERHGGSVEKFIGDAVMAVFGVPTVREDDALRAVRAAVELRDGVEIEVRIGLNTGPVVAGAGDTLVTGDAVNVAARLEQAAGSGEVLLGEATYDLVRNAVEAELLPPVEAKGKSEPLTAYRVHALTGETAVARRYDTPLVGRDRERQLLAAAWERARSERACVLFTILGVAGVGKSRLAVEFLDGVDATVVRGHCLPYGDGITYSPVVEIVEQLLHGAPPPDGAIAALLGEGAASVDDIAYAVRKLLEGEAADRSLVVVLDDLQWAEPALLDLVEHIADWSRGTPMILLCLARPDLLDRRPGWGGGKLNATTVLLEPLTGSETDELIDRLLGGEELEDALRARIRDTADGNPLFVEQMLALLHERGGDVVVPPSVQALLAARLDQLPQGERAALECGAVEGRVFHRGAVAALDGDPALLLPLVRKELVRPTDPVLTGEEAFRFRHLLIRDAAYDALPKAVRATLHERFAGWLEHKAPGLVELDELVGYHLEQAAGYRAELAAASSELEVRAARHLGAAGTRAVERSDGNAAVSLLGRAVSLLPAGGERAVLLARLGFAFELLGRFDDAFRVLDEAIATGDDDAAAFAFFMKLVVQSKLSTSTSLADALRAARERLDALGPDANPLALACGYVTLAVFECSLARVEEGLVDAAAALEHARKAGDLDFERKAMFILGTAKASGSSGWREVAEHAEAMRAHGTIDWLSYAAMSAAQLGRIEESRALYEQVVRQRLERGEQVRALGLAMTRGWVEMMAGNAERGEQLLREAWDGLGELGERGARSTVGAIFADVLARLGKADEAEAVLAEVDAITAEDDVRTIAQAMATRALVASCRGDHGRAVRLARKAVEYTDRFEFLPQRHDAWMEFGEVLLAAGRRREARDALVEARRLAEQKGSVMTINRVDSLLRDTDQLPSPNRHQAHRT